jgi:ribosomal small subunit protein bTHX
MGKGDKKTRRGKIIMGSFGNRRPRTVKNDLALSATPTDTAKATKAPKADKKLMAETKAVVKDTPKKPSPRKPRI